MSIICVYCLLCLKVLFALLVKICTCIVRLWLPEAHVESRVAVSIIWAGALLTTVRYLLRLASVLTSLVSNLDFGGFRVICRWVNGSRYLQRSVVHDNWPLKIKEILSFQTAGGSQRYISDCAIFSPTARLKYTWARPTRCPFISLIFSV
jgi:hypothetical protein